MSRSGRGSHFMIAVRTVALVLALGLPAGGCIV
jgi:hypothetical protein